MISCALNYNFLRKKILLYWSYLISLTICKKISASTSENVIFFLVYLNRPIVSFVNTSSTILRSDNSDVVNNNYEGFMLKKFTSRYEVSMSQQDSSRYKERRMPHYYPMSRFTISYLHYIPFICT